mgnify:CR=1 FL=1
MSATLLLAALVAFQQRYFVARNALILIVGALDRPAAEAIAARVAGALPAGEPAPPVPPVAAQPDVLPATARKLARRAASAQNAASPSAMKTAIAAKASPHHL